MSEDNTNKPPNDYGSNCVYGDCDRKSDGDTTRDDGCDAADGNSCNAEVTNNIMGLQFMIKLIMAMSMMTMIVSMVIERVMVRIVVMVRIIVMVIPKEVMDVMSMMTVMEILVTIAALVTRAAYTAELPSWKVTRMSIR